MYFMVLSEHDKPCKLHIILNFQVFMLNGYVSRPAFVFRNAKIIIKNLNIKLSVKLIYRLHVSKNLKLYVFKCALQVYLRP